MLLRYANILLRLFTLGVRFLFVVVIAQLLTAEEVADYGYITAFVGYVIYIVGFEFYTYANRELIKAEENERFSIIFNQQVLYIALYICILPILYIILMSFGFNEILALIICAISVFEHLCQEWNRILISIGKVNKATVVLFIRGGAWSIVVTLLMVLDIDARNLMYITVSWLISLIIAFLICIHDTWLIRQRIKIDIKWVYRGVASCFILFIASLASRGIVTFDRFFIGEVSDKSVLAAYTVYITISNALLSAIDAAVVSFLFPGVVRSAQKKNKELFYSALKDFTIKSLVVGAGFGLILIIGIELLVGYFSNSVYLDNLFLFKWILLVNLISVLALPCHLGLYSMKGDLEIMISSVVGFIFFLMVSIITIVAKMDAIYIIYGMILSTVIMLCMKFYYFVNRYRVWFI